MYISYDKKDKELENVIDKRIESIKDAIKNPASNRVYKNDWNFVFYVGQKVTKYDMDSKPHNGTVVGQTVIGYVDVVFEDDIDAGYIFVTPHLYKDPSIKLVSITDIVPADYMHVDDEVTLVDGTTHKLLLSRSNLCIDMGGRNTEYLTSSLSDIAYINGEPLIQDWHSYAIHNNLIDNNANTAIEASHAKLLREKEEEIADLQEKIEKYQQNLNDNVVLNKNDVKAIKTTAAVAAVVLAAALLGKAVKTYKRKSKK